MYFDVKINKNRVLEYIFKLISVKIVFILAPWGPLGAPLGTLGPLGPLGLGDAGALGTRGLRDPWALGALGLGDPGPWRPLGPWARILIDFSSPPRGWSFC